MHMTSLLKLLCWELTQDPVLNEVNTSLNVLQACVLKQDFVLNNTMFCVNDFSAHS